jgi:cell division protein FtsQ
MREKSTRPLLEALQPHADFAARAGFAASMLYLLVAVLYAAALSGAGANWRDRMAAAADSAVRFAGFGIHEVVVRGNSQVSEKQIADAIAPHPIGSMLSFDADAARDRLLALKWVKTVELRRVWPSTLAVSVVERTPAAFWMNGDQTFAVDGDGVVLGPVAATELTRLPRLRGDGASQAAHDLLAAIAAQATVAAAFQSAERISSRRWNLTLASGAVARLPEAHVQALSDLENFLTTQSAPSYPQILDLRVPGQIVITEDAHQAVALAPANSEAP